VQKLRAKDIEVENLRKEVERLAGEVEVLKGIVEEGLKERREARESLEQSRLEESVCEEEADEGYHVGGELSQFRQLEEESEANETAELQQSHNSVAPVEEPMPIGNGRPHPSDRRLRTEHTAPRSPVPATRQLLDGAHVNRICKELDDRRSSGSKSPSPVSQSRIHAASNGSGEARPAIPTSTSEIVREFLPELPRVRIPHPNAPISDSSSRGRRSPVAAPSSLVPTVPFPQIRGKRLEKLFFAAPEHDIQTCKVCHRKRRSGTTDLLARTPSLPPKKHDTEAPHVAFVEDQDTEDEGFVEGSECGSDAKLPPKSSITKGKQQERIEVPQEDELERNAKPNGPPPQTVLTHVLREIEDDFTHYKAYAFFFGLKSLPSPLNDDVSVYVELADQYKLMDAVSNVPKRNILAQHLKEVVDILEQKVQWFLLQKLHWRLIMILA
jgi:hypothetical protein